MRLKAGLKQYELAQLLSAPATIICDFERGRRPITPEVEKRIREAIDEALNRKTTAALSGKRLGATYPPERSPNL